MRKIGKLVFLLILFMAPWLSAQVAVQAEISSGKVGVGQSVNVEVRVTSSGDVSIEEPVPPPFDGFRLLGSHQSTQVSTRMQSGANGMEYNTQKTTTFTYRLQAAAAGQREIKAFSINVDGKEFKTAT